MKGKPAVFLRLGFDMRVGYTRRRNPLSRESGVISNTFLFYLYYIINKRYIYSFSNQIKLYVFLICCHSTTAGLSSAHS